MKSESEGDMRPKLTAPCKDCKERSPGCHGRCEKYRDYRAELDVENAERLARDERKYNISSYYNDRANKWLHEESRKAK